LKGVPMKTVGLENNLIDFMIFIFWHVLQK